ncbi:MAG: NAD(+)/NADH kinase, partial [Treponema sp.]|nr:NAD(+)/NADH kinase [Treponema sp.]
PLGEIKADGIIISTATGSTAYSASAGGPIIDPDLDAMVLTLMNAFSLSSRPLVLSPDGELEIEILPSRISDVVISVDGQIPVDLHVGDVIRIRQSEFKAKLIGCTKEKFYNALRSKLNWSGGPQHA